ncbi:MAG TPA: VOC family protein [Pirellulales bacterium]|jgi:PhnB protein|nr:VOC family protein [Pirellulales bacterium]
MKLSPYLNFNGECEAAFKFYERCLGGKIEAMFLWGGTPAEESVPADWRKKVMHASLFLGEQELLGADLPPDAYRKPQGISVMLGLTDTAQAERMFHALAEKGTIRMALQETFWAARFGQVTDQFGIPWMINCAKKG